MKYRNSAEVIPAELLEEIQDKSTTEYPQNSILDEMKGWIKDNFEVDNWKSADKNEFMNTLEKLTSLYDSLRV